MAKKKTSSNKQKERRKKEIIKAQVKSGMRGSVLEKLVDDDVIDTKPKKITHRLHLKEIKTDLLKTAIFAVFIVVLLIVLKSQGLQFDFSVNK